MSVVKTRCTGRIGSRTARTLLYATFLGLLFSWPARAQFTRFQHLSEEQGLGNSAVEAVAQDQEGYILFGTQFGLYRYDGTNVAPYAADDLSGAYVLSIIPDVQGRLWVVTSYGVYVRSGSTFSRIDTGRASLHLRSAHLLALTEASAVLDVDGTILRASVGASSIGAFLPLFDAATLARVPGLGRARFVAPDAHDALLIGCGVAICRADGGRVTILGEADGLPPDAWQVALRAPDGTLWVRSLDRLARRAPGKARFEVVTLPDGGSGPNSPGHTSYASRPDVLDLLSDRHGGVLTQYADGLIDWNGVAWHVYPHHQDGLPTDRIDAMMLDREGSLWAGSFGNGAFRSIGLRRWEHWTNDDGLPSSTVWSITRLPNRQLWVATDSGVVTIEGAAGRLSSETSYVVRATLGGRLWLGPVASDLMRFDPVRNVTERFPAVGRVVTAIVDRTDRLWIATPAGLFMVTNADAPAPDIHPVLVLAGDCNLVTTDPAGTVWALSSGSIFRQNATGHFDPIVHPPPAKAPPNALTFGADDEIWLGTASEGVQRFRLTGHHVERLPSIVTPTIGSNDIVSARRDRRGWIWLGTDRGLDMFDGRSWRRLDSSNGLITDDTAQDAIAEDLDGSMWFGTSRGLSHLIDPTRLPPPATLHPLITGLSFGDQALPVRPSIDVDWTRAPLVIRFVDLDYAHGRAIAFRYRMTGLDTGWSTTTGHEVRYADLPAGHFRFELIAVDAVHGMASVPAGFKIHVLAPWWRRWWFYGVCALALVSLLIEAWRMRVHILLGHQRRLEELVGARTAEIEQARIRLEHMAMSDALTGLANRRAIMNALDEALASASGSGGPLAVLLYDIDHFKKINDGFGHLAGDEVLIAFGARLATIVSGPEAVGRYGGEEFLLILHGDPDLIMQRAAAIHLVITGAPYHFAGEDRSVTSSGGIAFLRAGDTALSLLERADTALYQAKQDGRNRIEEERSRRVASAIGMAFASMAADDAAPPERRNLKRDLRAALDDEEFVLHYQPIVDLEKDIVTSFEVLLRWQSPSRGMVPPGDFIPFAEEAGLMPEIGDWVLRTACREAAGWRNPVKISINLSPRQFLLPDLVGRVAGALAEAGLPPERLELEVTETAMIDDVATAGLMLQQLRTLGITIALDDFGIGYSSLSFVSTLPFDRIKVDRCFVQALGIEPEAMAVIRALVVLCGGLGVAITAEGVESDRQIELLRAEGCFEVQGFRIARPGVASEMQEWLAGFMASRSHESTLT